MKFRSFLALPAAAVLAGCNVTPTLPGLPPYRIDIQQGNHVSQEMVSQLKRGMTREQVRFVLGTPLVTDVFNADRWDYIYYFDPAGKPRQQRRLAVFFDKEGKLVRVDGDVMPASEPAAASAPPAPKPAPVPTKPAPLPEMKAAEPPPTQNWRTASDPEPPAAAELPKPEPAKPEPAAASKPDGGEPGFFGRLWNRVTGKD